ncbi:MAG: DUF3244 domain-containing protein [Muribaculum sp.]|nr:DUF3244 domain-containing protein [Muribaculum sp.]MDE6459128.1 DUF3244 domain-containing protein [Muribaculum sp.]
MRKEKIIAFAVIALGTMKLSAEEVVLKYDNDPSNSRQEIPIRVDLDQSSKLLRVDFKKCIDCTVIVSGADGIVYQQSISAKNYQSVRLDLKPYEEGDYEIVFYDTEGNVIDGSFYLKNKIQKLY